MTETEKMIMDIHGSTKRIEQKLDSHIDNKPIHALPPCDAVKTLNSRVWAGLIASVTALGGIVYGFLAK